MATLSASSVEWAVKCLSLHQDTDLLPRTFEYDAIKHHHDDVVKLFSKQDICQWQTRPFRKCLVPKHKFGFRLATQLDPLDMILYLGLLYEVGESIELARIPANKNISFSYRFAPNDEEYTLFDRNSSYKDFETHCAKLTEQYQYVIMADIADFYHRIYLHRIENALSTAIKSLPTHVKAITQLIKGWNHNISYGIPVGSNPSRLIADLVIDDVDRVLMSDSIVFSRFVDDYRIFCKSKQDAYRQMARLASLLFETHGLTLQSQKTRILTTEQFINEFINPEQRVELQALDSNFDTILASLGIDNSYEPIDIESLTEEEKAKLDKLNLTNLLDQQLSAEDIDVPITKFLLNRLAQIRKTFPLRPLLTQPEKIYPVIPEIVRYLNAVDDLINPDTRIRIGNYLLKSLRESVLGQLEFHKMQILSLFSESRKWGNEEQIPSMYQQTTDTWSRRELVQASGRAGQDYWLRYRKSEVEQLPIWEKRAYIYASSCFPKDERDNYYRAINGKLDQLEKWVLSWAQKNPIDG